MDLSKILSISGKRGLFKVVSQLKNAMLVESLIDGKRFPAFAHEKISSLEEIAVFTTGEDVQLKEILKKLHENQQGKPGPDSKTDDNALRSFFAAIIPDYDPERVYISDIRKIISWYNLLLEHNLLDFSEKEEEKKEGTEGTSEDEPVKAKQAEGTGKKPPVKARKPVAKEAGTHARVVKGKSQAGQQKSRTGDK
jgi:hypothetical protein